MKSSICGLIVVFLTMLSNAQEILGCSCGPNPPPCEAFGTASAVFVGVVVDSAEQKTVEDSGVKTVYDVGSIRFAVQEPFKGVSGKEVQIHSGTGGADCGYWFIRGQVYLVYAYLNSEDGNLWTNICTRTRALSQAKEDLDFLRGLTKAKPGGTLFGVLNQFVGDMEHGPFSEVGPMSNVTVVIEGESGRFEAITNKQGEYSVTGLPPGKYDARPILPENLGAIAQHDTVDEFGSYSGHEKIDLPDRSCAEMSFVVQFSGRISGRVTDKEGQPVKELEVDLANFDDLETDRSAWTDDTGHYEFHMIQPGSYVLGLNLSWVPSPKTPYPRTYYPGTSKQDDASVITFGEGTKLNNYDMTLPPRLVEKSVEGFVVWPDGRPAPKAQVIYEPSTYPGRSPGEREEADTDGHFVLKLFDGFEYTAFAHPDFSENKDAHAKPIVLTSGLTVPIKFILDQQGSGYMEAHILKESRNAKQNPTPSPTPSAAPPASDIYIVDVKTHNRQLTFGQPTKITNTVGYNNQPFFLPDGRSILYTSIRDKQADIYRYDIRRGATTQITRTPESEYSPTLMPDGKSISVVRVEADGTQRLWKFPLAGGTPSVILEKIKPVGYHLWIDDHTLALFILGKPNTLQIADTRTGKAEIIAENPGRILRRIPHENKFSFVHKVSDQEWIIKAYGLDSRKTTELIKTFAGVEDYAWTPAGDLLMAKDAKLFVRKKSDWAWQQIADYSNAGLKSITRIAVSPKGDRIAFVAR